MINLWKMERYQLFHNWIYWCGMIGMFIIGLVTAGSYVSEAVGPQGGAAASLCDIFDGMVYDSTFLLIVISSILAFVLGQEFSERTIAQEICAGHSRYEIFCSKIVTYLLAFNLMAIVYPLAGCIRELPRFGLVNISELAFHVVRATLYSFVVNSTVFLLPVLFCFLFRNMAKAIAATALLTFAISLYLGYGMMLGLPVWFLPVYQIRDVIVHPTVIVMWKTLAITFVWGTGLIILAWQMFRKCDLK